MYMNTSFSPEEIERYHSHFVLPGVGIEGQKKLKAARVLCVGLGGLGSPLVLYLAAAGLGTLGIIDADHIEASNLQRQILYADNEKNRPKVIVAKEKLLQLNPFVNIETYQQMLSEDNALSIIEKYDIVVDATDNYASRFLINDACFFLKKPNVYASVFQFEGQLSVFMPEHGPCYRCLYPDAPPANLVPNCAEGGILGALPGIMGSLQALEVIKCILGVGKLLIGKLLVFDGLCMSFREFETQKNNKCDICEKNISFADLARTRITCNSNRLSVQAFKALRDENKNFTLIDVREPFEYSICNLGGQLMPLGELPQHLQKLDKSQLIIVHCKFDSRSKQALSLLEAEGFSQVKILEGGIIRWIDQIDPSLTRY